MQRCRTLLANPKNLPYLFIGCHGPDPFFFNTKDLNPTLGKFVEIYNDLADFLRDFEQMLLDAVPQPVLDALAAFEEAANEVIEDSALLTELKQTFEDLNQLLTGFAALLTEALKKFVTDFNLFDIISHPYRDGASEGEWWWFDAMHYRKSGKLTAALLETTRDASTPAPPLCAGLPHPRRRRHGRPRLCQPLLRRPVPESGAAAQDRRELPGRLQPARRRPASTSTSRSSTTSTTSTSTAAGPSRPRIR